MNFHINCLLSLEKKGAENLGVKTKELSDKILASKSSFEKGEPHKKRRLQKGLTSLILFITT
jgi:hypothetical protein